MQRDMIKFPSIGDFKKAVKHARAYEKYHETSLGTVSFVGTEKLHGTNAGIRVCPNTGLYIPQGRNRKLTVEEDNYNFASHVLRSSCKSCVVDLVSEYYGREVILFGEYIGPKIQQKVAVSKLPSKQFVIFKVFDVFNERYIELPELSLYQLDELNDVGVFLISQIPNYRVDIDFSKWEEASETLTKLLDTVESESPWGKMFGISGVGEGLVFVPDCDLVNNTGFWFKVKGAEHKNVDKAKRNISQADAERAARLLDLVGQVLPDWRLEQGLLEFGKPIEKEYTRDYIGWVTRDTLKEQQDIILDSEFETKEVMAKVANIAARYFVEQAEK